MMVLLSKYLNNLFRIPKILFINCKINIILILSANCFIMANTISIDGQVLVLAMPDTMCSSSNSFNSRQCKTVRAFKISI